MEETETTALEVGIVTVIDGPDDAPSGVRVCKIGAEDVELTNEVGASIIFVEVVGRCS